MADTTRNIWNDNGGERVAPRPKKKHWKGVLSFLLILLVVLFVMLLAAYRDGTGFDVLRRYLHYGSSERSTEESVYDYDGGASMRFAAVEDCLVALSENSLQVLSPDGEEVWAVPLHMKNPALESGGGLAVAYDVGGTLLYVVNAYGRVMELEAEADEPLIAATLNENGWLAVTSEKKNHKGWVGVYDPEMELVFEFYSSRRFVLDACVTGDGTGLAAVTLGQEDGVFVNSIVLYDLTKEDPVASYNVPDGLVAAIEGKKSRIVTVTDTALTHAKADGTVASEYSFEGEFLRDYDLDGEEFSVLQLGRYSSGSMGRLVSVGDDGEVRGVLDVNEEILDISAAGRYLAVLYADRVVVYNSALQAYGSLAGFDQADGVLMRTDGSVLLLGEETAHLFLP